MVTTTAYAKRAKKLKKKKWAIPKAKVMKEHQRAMSSCVRGSITGAYRGCYLTRVHTKNDYRNGIEMPEESHSLAICSVSLSSRLVLFEYWCYLW